LTPIDISFAASFRLIAINYFMPPIMSFIAAISYASQLFTLFLVAIIFISRQLLAGRRASQPPMIFHFLL